MPSMKPRSLPLTQTLQDLPPEWPHDPLPAIRQALRTRGEKVVVLDDDPTGAQAVHDVVVVTEGSVDILAEELSNDLTTLFVLTNSRSLPAHEARSLNAEIGRNLREATALTGREIVVISRSDSTLRGHFPQEMDSLEEALGSKFDAWVLVPFFLEGGRYTLDDVHYVAEGDRLTPAGETEFAQDTAFAYRSSNLLEWVEEKTAGRVRAESVTSISIEDIRQGGPGRVAQRLAEVADGGVCIVNAAGMRDMEVFALGAQGAEESGRRFLYRTAASFVRARIGQTSRPILAASELDLSDGVGALLVVGSHVPKTTGQLEYLLEHARVTGIEIHVDRLLSHTDRSEEIGRVARLADRGLAGGDDVAVYTSRGVVAGENAGESLSVGKRISEGLVALVRTITTKPRYMLTKGGITASDIATQALGVKRAAVPGQILPGVPVWTLGEESRYPGLTYIVFPGNVGGPEALTDVVTGLSVGG